MLLIKRGEVWWIDFDPARGGEIQKIRPAVVMSNNSSNEVLNRIQVVPLTSNIEKCYPCEAYIFLNGIKNKAKADQIMTVSKERVKSKIATLSNSDMQLIEQAIKVQLLLTLS
jgi:mRNA interferase MazF